MTRVVTKLQFGALGSLLILAGCGGGSAAPASSPAPASAAAKPSTAASVAVSVAPATSAKPAASGAAAAKPSVALPAACSSAPSTAGVPTPLPASPSPKPSFTQQTDVIGEPAPGPYTQIGPQLTVNPGTPGKVYVPGLYFAPNTIVVKAGEQVTLNFTNCSSFAHNFYSPALGTPKVDIPAGGDSNVSFTAPTKPGKYMYWCAVQPPSSLSHGERGETGEIIVQ